VKEASASFLKKRSKKLLSWGTGIFNTWNSGAKVFWRRFFTKKRPLSYHLAD
jgi:hypothetical protein